MIGSVSRPLESAIAAGLVAMVGAAIAAGCCAFSSPGWVGPQSAHFDGEQFKNVRGSEQPGVGAFLRWGMTRQPGPWRDYENAPPGPPPPPRVGRGELRVTWIGHATVLVQIDRVNVLTDPVWSHRIGPVPVKPRVRPPGIRFEDLPRIDVVVLSHNHYDHFDLPTIRSLAQRDHPLILTGLGNVELLEEAGIEGGEALDWWEHEEVAGVRVTAVPAQHFSMRGACDRDTSLWAGFVIEGQGGPVYFAGDTGWGPHFAEIRQRFGPMRLALLPIGAYEPRWLMASMHIDPGEAVAAHRVLGAATSVGIHHSTFAQADEGQDAPVRDLGSALSPAEKSAGSFVVLGFGEGRDLPALARPAAVRHSHAP